MYFVRGCVTTMISEEDLRPAKTALIADDVFSARKLYSKVIGDLGFQIETAEDGVDAVNKIRKLQPDLVILDIGMPRMDGLEVLKRSQENSPTTRFIVITAHKDRDTVLKVARQGVVSYLTKPVNLHDLRKRVLAATTGP